MLQDGDEDTHTTEIVLENKGVAVKKVHISGLNRTKADFVIDEVKPLFKSTTFLEAYTKAILCKEKLLAKGVFKQVSVIIDTVDSGDDGPTDNIQVVFKAREKNMVVGEVKTEMSNSEKPRWVLRLLSPNVMGRGESLSASVSHTLSSHSGKQIYEPTDFQFSFMKPQENGSLQSTLLKEKNYCSWSSYNETIRGLETGLKFPFLGNSHEISWNCHWRELTSSRSCAFAVRQLMGHSLKSSINHTMIIDRCDDHIFPSSGVYVKMSEELAGLGGNVKFFKEVVDFHLATTLLKRVTLSLGMNVGFVIGKAGQHNINDKFFVGGPLTLRGFEINSVGKQEAGCYLGSTAFWLLDGHIYTPLPFYWHKFGHGFWLDNFRFHAFVNGGNSFDVDTQQNIKSNISAALTNLRLTFGFGLVYRFMRSARLELNFCFPVRAAKTDKICEGIQFGIGVSSV